MKTINKRIIKYFGVLILGIILTTSCEDFLDKSPKVNITEENVYGKFLTFQGFIEEAYQCIVDQSYGTAGTMNFNFGDDILLPGGASTGFTSPEFDRGNYWEPLVNRASVFYGDISSVTNGSDKGYWQNGWYGIRIANLAIANADRLIDGTDEERDLIKGQAYFFRGYFHFEILRSWGGIPYVDTTFGATDKLTKPRLTYKQTADRITADLQAAAAVLPASWDEATFTGQTIGRNAGRITKGAAYGYIGKNLLYLASPLMNGIETGNYTYNVELCKQAAEAFYEVIKLTNLGYHGLETWANYKSNFYAISTNNIMPKGKEIVFSSPYQTAKTSGQSTGEHVLSNFGGFGVFAGPTENYIENFGMKNGLPITAAGSGYNPADPWTNRDPRFDYSVGRDGTKLIINPVAYPSDATFKSYVGGRHRGTLNTCTGYSERKFIDIGCNPDDKLWSTYSWEVTALRLVDIYLMYAEAVNEAYGPTTIPANIPGGITAAEAVNIVRRRVLVTPGNTPLPDIDAQFLTSTDVFRETIRQERAVELCFEGHRWFDLRRWHVSHLMKYRQKYALDFDQPHTYFNKTLWTTIVFEDKHYWLPFPVAQVTLYPEFKQNPGW